MSRLIKYRLLVFLSGTFKRMKPVTPAVSFRNDINGLRAYAVIAVLLFHFQIPWFSAGFLGVDIFFVISGFLMTAIIVRGLEKGNFSIWKFYMARIRRIVPALMFLIAVLLVLGWFFLPTPDYKALGSQSAYSSAFISNIYFWRSSGYFDASAHEKWLLHTWTLGVEAQFYLLLPVFLIVLWKIKPQAKTLLWGLIFAFFASFFLSVVASSLKPVASFYLLPTRGWEFIAGGLVFFAGRELKWLDRFSKAFLWTGFSLLLLSFVLIDSSFSWPSGWALLPVTATAFIMLAQQSTSVLTAHPIAQWLGDRSYSLYLWHWPIVVALYFADLHTNWFWMSGGLILSFFLGDLSYRLIETPTRIYFSKASNIKQVLVIGVSVMLVGISAVSARLFVFEGRLPPDVEISSSEGSNINPYQKNCYEISNKTNTPIDCKFNESPVGVYLLGDSHANSVFTALGATAEKYNKTALYWSKAGCPTLKGAKFNSFEGQVGCYDFNNLAFDKLENIEGFIPVVIVNRLTRALINGNEESKELQGMSRIYFDEEIKMGLNPVLQEQFRESLIQTSCMLVKKRPVYLVRPIPEIGIDVPKNLSRNIIFGRGNDDIKITLKEYHQRHDFVWKAQDLAAEQCGVKILNPLPYLCDDKYCYGSKNGRPLFFDDDHLSEYGNKFLIPMFEQVFSDQKNAK